MVISWNGKLNFFSIKKRQIAPVPIQIPITKYHLNKMNPQMLIAKIETIPIKLKIEAKSKNTLG